MKLSQGFSADMQIQNQLLCQLNVMKSRRPNFVYGFVGCERALFYGNVFDDVVRMQIQKKQDKI